MDKILKVKRKPVPRRPKPVEVVRPKYVCIRPDYQIVELDEVAYKNALRKLQKLSGKLCREIVTEIEPPAICYSFEPLSTGARIEFYTRLGTPGNPPKHFKMVYAADAVQQIGG